ncbi:MAG: OsmC family protein [Deltaproteobacteria bacterium]
MQPFPHHYTVAALASAEGEVQLESERLPALASAAPLEFGGPGDRWSPESLCVGAVADCFVLTFRAIARASKLPWTSLRCNAEGTLDRIERVTQFTSFVLRATLQVPPGTDEARARQLLERAEQTCLISQSLKGTSHLEASVETLP